MFASIGLCLALSFQAAAEVDPNKLDIGRRGTVNVQNGQIVDRIVGAVPYPVIKGRVDKILAAQVVA